MNKSTNIAGTIATAIAILYTFIGIPSQIIRNWERGSTEGVSGLMFGLLFFCYLAWFIYAIFKKDKYLLITNITGLVSVSVLLTQIYVIYRH